LPCVVFWGCISPLLLALASASQLPGG
jgi:hypothetical protein